MPNLSGLSTADCAQKFLESEEIYLQKGLRTILDCFVTRFAVIVYMERSSSYFKWCWKNRLSATRKLQLDVPINQLEEQSLFLNVVSIFDFNQKLFNRLSKLRLTGEAAFTEGIGSNNITFVPVSENANFYWVTGKVMKELIPFFKLYTSYIQGSRSSMELLSKLSGAQFLLRNLCVY